MANATWNVNEISAMNHETNLRNLCRQLEQQYVEWKQNATYRGFCISRDWPAMGELGRYLVSQKPIMRFVTTKKRSIQIHFNNEIVAECAIKSGLANELYLEAGRILDAWELKQTEVK